MARPCVDGGPVNGAVDEGFARAFAWLAMNGYVSAWQEVGSSNVHPRIASALLDHECVKLFEDG